MSDCTGTIQQLRLCRRPPWNPFSVIMSQITFHYICLIFFDCIMKSLQIILCHAVITVHKTHIVSGCML